MAIISDELANSIQKCFDRTYVDLANQQQFLFGAGDVTVTKPDGTTGTVKSWAQFLSEYSSRQTAIDGAITAAGKNVARTSSTNTFTQPQTFSNGVTFSATITAAGQILRNNSGTQFTAIDAGSLEISSDTTPYIDFHHKGSVADYTHRIITEDGALAVYPGLRVRGGFGVYGIGTVYGANYANAMIAKLENDPSNASVGDIIASPRFIARFNTRGSDSHVDGGQGGVWFEENVGYNHRLVLMCAGFNANVQYWQFLADGRIYSSQNGNVQWQGTSDARLKHDIEPTDGQLSVERIRKLELVTFVYNDDEQNRTRRGIIAQQAQKVDPQYVKQVNTSYMRNGEQVNDDRLQLDNNVIMMDTLAAVKVLLERVDELEERLSAHG
ncbi:TPA: tail fiber domain-containing protein [Klebsiella pneumoniae]|uniref:tail fiber domain-containing protein n=1 Tax=Enterobacteriaceae TaxID=543 RepID=UPI001E3EDF43|nr:MULTISPECIES: tail fiber domain-containing protein [Enterobacteriaceae]MCD5654356.1 tail fiber domain-containing protein [Klebsiella pneumoniae]MCW8154179.1 tail fiber domain-containing protein [Enterobacter hormaechei]HBQ1354902.1 tail fiber domain-containing protein [Klebsiella pneumoniae]HBV4664521.1 tail fiber domain-containing protein [Klebsiella pneumoniae]HBV5732487.1 tail fiber domain-containing protein [Klebsiella pneumoniae]